MAHILSFLFHLLLRRLFRNIWGRDTLLSPSTFLHNRYLISQVHEQGGENVVYLAYDQILDKDVAIKENMQHDRAHERQFEWEASILGHLSHPNIPRAYEYFTEERRQFFVMDYIEGINLERVMKRRKPGTQEILDWAVQLCDILAYLHSIIPAIIHCDVQPSNIILGPNGQIFLVDFGFVKVHKPQGERLAIARPSLQRPAEMGATEIIDQQMARPAIPRIIDRRSDQYALAATLYCLLTGAPPLDSMERLAGKAELASIRADRSDLSASAEQVLFRALSLDQNRRYSDIEEFKIALIAET